MLVVNRAPGGGGANDITMSSCMCEPMGTAQSIGDDTCGDHHTGQRTSEHRLRRSAAWSIVSVGCELGPTMGALNEGRSERKAPKLANVNKLTSKHEASVTLHRIFQHDTRRNEMVKIRYFTTHLSRFFF